MSRDVCMLCGGLVADSERRNHVCKQYVVESCHEGTALCVRNATDDDEEDELHTYVEACASAKKTIEEWNKDRPAHVLRARWFDFSE